MVFNLKNCISRDEERTKLRRIFAEPVSSGPEEIKKKTKNKHLWVDGIGEWEMEQKS